MNSFVNKQIYRHWTPKGNPPPNLTNKKNISREKVSILIGMCGNGQLIRPIFTNGNVGIGFNIYLTMLDDDIIPYSYIYF